MNEERPIRLLRTRWERGLLAMVGWSLVLHVAAAGGVLAVLPWAGARTSRPIPAYTVELTSLGAGSAKPVGVLPGKKPKSPEVSPTPGDAGKTQVKPKQPAPAPKAPKTTPKSAKATKAKTPETAKEKTEKKEAPKKPPSADRAESGKSKEPAKKVIKPTKTLAVKKAEPKKAEPKKPTTVATAKKGSSTKPAPKSDATTGAKKDKASAQPSGASKPTAQKESVRADKKGEGAADKVRKDGEGQNEEDDGDLADDPRYAAAIESVRRRVAKSGGGPGGADGSQVGATGEGGQVGGGDRVVGTEFLIYYNIMISHIKQAWVWVGHDQSLSVTVRFAIEPDGEIRNLRIDRSSGDSSYDQSVLEAVGKVNPLPPPPAAYSRDFRQVELTFRPGDLREAG